MSNKVPLRELCIKDEWGKYGIPASAEEFDESKTRYLRITDISEDGELLNSDRRSVSAPDIDKYILKEGDIVFARTGNSTGKTYYHKNKNGKLAFAGFLIKYSLDSNKVIPEYLKYYTISNEYKNWVKNLSVGSTRGNINAQTFGDCPITLPNRAQQNLLVSTLSKFVNKIELNNRINAELEAMAKALYDYWFVQFDFPDANGQPYKSSGGKMVWNEELKREVPEGWEVGQLNDIADLVRGVSYDKTDIKTSNSKFVVPILRATNLSGNVIDLKNMVYVTEDKVSQKQFLNKYDILITMSSGSIDHIGKNGFFYFDDKVSFGTFCAKLVAKGDYRFYLFSYTQSDFMFKTIRNECLGTNINNLNSSLVNGFQVLIPPSNFVAEFNLRVSNAFEKIGNNVIENRKLAELRDWLLPMLMNGQVKMNGYAVAQEEEPSYMMAAEPEVKYEVSKRVNIPDNKKAFVKQVLAGKIVDTFKDDSNFTHIKFQKLQYLAEHIAEVDLNWNYYRQAAGPYDPAFMHTINTKFKNSKWFEERQYRFYALPNAGQIDGYYRGYFGPVHDKIAQLFQYFATAKEEQVEIVATLYAVWNNYLINKAPFSDEDIIDTFFEWSSRKTNYTRERVTICLNWMKQHNLVPVGWGKLIKEKK